MSRLSMEMDPQKSPTPCSTKSLNWRRNWNQNTRISLTPVAPIGSGTIVLRSERGSDDSIRSNYGLAHASSPVEERLVPRIREDDVVWTTKWEKECGEQVLDIIGSGKYGVVYRAVYRGDETGREEQVVIKQNNTHLPEKEILQEAQFLQLLGDTGYVPRLYGLVSGCGQSLHRGLSLVQSVFGEGVTLGSVMHDAEKLPPQRRPRVAWHLAVGLKAIHDRGVLINDLHADNVLLDFSCFTPVRFIDFGCASSGSVNTSFDLADPVTEAALHLALEVKNGQPMTPESDIYDLGMIIYQLINDVDDYWPPPLMREAVERCTDEDPKKRDIEEVISMLHKCLP